MSTTNASVNTSGNSLFGTGIPAQILIALLAGLILFIVLFSIESFIKTINRYAMAKVVLVPDTVTSNRAIVFRQNPSDEKVKNYFNPFKLFQCCTFRKVNYVVFE